MSNCGTSSPLIFSVQSFINSQCNDCADTQCLSSEHVCYKGADLACSGILYNDSVETALIKIDEQICSAIGDYSTYQKNCLPTWFGEAINDEATFVDAITAYACTIATNLETFTGVDFPQYQSQVAAQISQIDGPAIICASAGVNSGDSLTDILIKYCAKFADIDEDMNLSDIVWDSCFSVVGTPSSLHQGFEEVLSQICQVKEIAEDGSGILPTFNNVGSCLDTPGSNDSLSDTVIKIRTKLCQIDSTFDGSTLTWLCNTPDSDSLQDAVQELINATGTLTQVYISEVSDDFTLSNTDPDNPCAGKTLALATPLTADRLVAASETDTSPSVLIDKIGAGDGISVDLDVSETSVVVSSLGLVMGDATDDTLGFLVDKLEGSTVNGITITPVYNPSTKKVTLQLTIDDQIFCAAVGTCVPPSCITYTVENTSGIARIASWQNCDGSMTTIGIDDGATITTCAVLNSVTGAGLTITPSGDCTTTTTAAP